MIAKFVEEELLQAERQGVSDASQSLSESHVLMQCQRPSRVRRFLKSDIELLDVTMEELTLEVPDEPGEPATAEVKTAPAPLLPQIRHFITINGSPAAHIQLFHLRDLPQGSLERVLTKLDKVSESIVSQGLTPRIVRWDVKKAKYVFNGRTGTAILPKGLI